VLKSGKNKRVVNQNNNEGIRKDYSISFDKNLRAEHVKERSRSNSRSLSGGRNTNTEISGTWNKMNYINNERKFVEEKEPIINNNEIYNKYLNKVQHNNESHKQHGIFHLVLTFFILSCRK